MPTFRYEGAFAGGEKVSGVVEAASRQEAVAEIRQTCEIVLSLKEVPKTLTHRTSAAMMGKITPKSLALACQQFSIVLKAGLPLVQTVDLVAGQCEDKALKRLLEQVSEDVSNGWSMSYSLDQRGGKLPVTFRETIQAGEESGDLVSAFERMAKYYDRTSKTRAKTISTMTYPAFVIVVAIVVVYIIMTKAVPAFIGTFADMDMELPGVTLALIAISDFTTKYGVLVAAVLVAIIAACWLFSRTQKGGLLFSRLRLSLPVLGEIGRMGGASQFAHTMSAMLAAGVPILQAIAVSSRSMSSLIMAQEVMDTIPGVEAGKGLGESMSHARELPQMLIQMTAVGESAGALESTLNVLAEYYDNEVDVRTDRALSLLEPIIICVLAVFVVLILFAVYMPLFSMYNNI